MNNNLPFVSVCTPTFNRRPFIPFAIKCFNNFIYPKDRIEWIIVDDGTDPIADLVSGIPQIKYCYIKDKMPLGKKRNYMHNKCKGDIIVYMDDDDYYPPDRIMHSVQTLLNNPSYLIAGSSAMLIYYDSLDKIYCCGPYKENHATAATFAFKRELLLETKYDEKDTMMEEKKFLKDYTIPLIQLDPLKSILVFSHKHNSLNKEKLLENPVQFKMKLTNYKVDDIILDTELLQFYKYNMNNLLVSYEPGRPENKPEVLADIKRIEESREKKIKELTEKQKILDSFKSLYNGNNVLTNDCNELKKTYEKKLEEKNLLINELLKKIKLLTQENNELKNKI